ncbi:MAG: DNA polymerase IV [Spirochaetales bacterium]|nr:DNA polymerase IV [Spirochaetales bacterium]
MKTVFFHADLDAFFTSVEQADNPALKGIPTIVGALPGQRGVVAACSYEARKFGIHSAMPISQAFRKCPQAVYLPARMDRYIEVSGMVMGILQEFTPRMHQISIDEAFLEMTGTERLMGTPWTIAETIKNAVQDKLGLCITIGIAPNKYCAKLVSSYCKPDGLYEVLQGEEIGFLDSLALKDLWGIGQKTLARLNELNIMSIPQLREYSREILSALLGRACAEYIHAAVNGKDPGIYPEQPKHQSISSERTFSEDCRNAQDIKKMLLQLSHEIMFRCMKQKKKAATIVLKLRYWDFSTVQTQHTVKNRINSAEELYRQACLLLEKKWDKKTPLRLVGLGLANVSTHEELIQPELFVQPDDKSTKLEKAVYTIRNKYAGVNITKARLMKKKNSKNGT